MLCLNVFIMIYNKRKPGGYTKLEKEIQREHQPLPAVATAEASIRDNESTKITIN